MNLRPYWSLPFRVLGRVLLCLAVLAACLRIFTTPPRRYGRRIW